MSNSNYDTLELVKRLNQTANGFRPAILLLTANRLGLFTHLAGRRLSAQSISQELKWDDRATPVFLNALAAMGFLRKEEGEFSNAEISQQLLVRESSLYQGDILNHNLNLLERWARMDEVILGGKSPRVTRKRREGVELRAFIGGMANLAALHSESLWDKVDLSSYGRLLDVGGGPGSYALYACQINPKLEAVIFDLPEVEPIFHEHHAASGVGKRAQFHAGDYLHDPLPEGFDLCLLSNIIHSLGAEDNRRLIAKIRHSLNPGGLLVIKDFFISQDGTKPLFAALFAVNMLLGTEEGGCYMQPEVERWLSEAGFAVRDYVQLDEQSGAIMAVNRRT